MRPIFQIIFLSAAIFFSGCSVKTDVLTKTEAMSFDNKTLVYTQVHELPDFTAQTAANVQFGLLGIASAVSNGNKMISENHVKDPAIQITKELTDGLVLNHHVKVAKSTEALLASTSVAELANQYPEYDYILDVRTLAWGSLYFPTDWNNYRVLYNVHARIIDQKKAAVIAEEVCNYDPDVEDTDSAPSYDDLEHTPAIANALKEAVKYCVKHIQDMTHINTVTSLLTDKLPSQQENSVN